MIRDAPQFSKKLKLVGKRLEPSTRLQRANKVGHLQVRATESIMLKVTSQRTSFIFGSRPETNWINVRSSRRSKQPRQPSDRPAIYRNKLEVELDFQATTWYKTEPNFPILTRLFILTLIHIFVISIF